jgi:hypothetical protein
VDVVVHADTIIDPKSLRPENERRCGLGAAPALIARSGTLISF